jgi:prepilin-type N-terminal cleavage/methylation domain-containing protein
VINRKGFTLLEVLLSVAVLSVGSLVIASAFMKTADLVSVTGDRYPAELLCRNLMVEAEENLIQEKDVERMPLHEKIDADGRHYEVQYEYRPYENSKNLYELTVTMEWISKRKNLLKRSLWILI